MDHHQIIIITASAISVNYCYLSILLIIGSSTEPSLFHASCRPNIHVRLHQQSQPFFMLDVFPCPCKEFPYRAIPFSCWMHHLAFVRNSPTESTLFHVGCNTLPLQGFPLQSQPFFMLDAVPCLCKGFLYKETLFHVGFSAFHLQGLSLQSQSFFILYVVPCLCKEFL